METLENKTQEKKELTLQARDRALGQVIKNWKILKNENLISQKDWEATDKLITKAIENHIAEKYGI